MDIIQGINRSHGLAADQTQGSNVDAVVVALRGKLERACERLSKDLYNSQSHFILEFVQNADDNHYDSNVVPTLNLRMRDREMVIECNEKGFDEDNVKAICDIGASTKAKAKKVEGYIGEKGIGFKAVFVVAQQVHVASRHFMFRFERDGTLGMINPIWDTSYPINHGWTTFHLQLAPVVDRSDLEEQIGGIQPSLLLFLRKLRSIDIDIAKGKKKRSSLVSVRRIDESDDIIRLERHENSRCVLKRRYIVVKKMVNTYVHEEKRKGIEQSEIILAFPINDDGQPETTEQYVHAFLPVATYGLNFVVQGDFLTSSSREDIIADSQWNRVLLEGVTATFLVAVARFRQHHDLRDSWMRYIPLNARGPFKAVQDSIFQSLRTQRVLRDVLDNDQLPTNLITIPTDFQLSRGDPLIDASDLPPSKYYISSSYDVDRDWVYLSKLGVTAMSTQQFLEGLRTMDRRNGFARCSEEWHEIVCRYLRVNVSRRRGRFDRDILNLRILPLADGTWGHAASASEYCFPADLDLSHLVGLTFISSEVRSYTSRYAFFEALGVRPANATVVANHILQSHRAYTLSDMVRIAHFFFNHRDDRGFPSPKSRLFVMDEGEDEALGHELYLDVTLADGQSLRSLLPHTRFLHSAYIPPSAYQTSLASWRSWLQDHLGIHTRPRIVNGRMSQEFREMTQSLSHAPGRLLGVLRQCWPIVSEELSQDGLGQLSQVAVVCTDGTQHKLAETALQRRSLKLMQIPSQSIHFIDVSNPDDKQWDFLGELGVMLEPNAHAWLEVLKRLQTTEPAPVTLTRVVKEAYKQLDARFNEAPDDIRRAFREHPLLLRTPRDDTFTKLQWVGMNAAYWQGPSYLEDILIGPSHPGMTDFFVEKLRLPSLAPPSAVIDRLLRIAETHADKNLPKSERSVVEEILLTLAWWCAQSPRNVAAISELKRLRDKAIFPVWLTTAETVTLRSVDGFYVHRSCRVAEEKLRGRVPLLATTPRLRIPNIKPLLDSEIWPTPIKYLEPPVLEVNHEVRGQADAVPSLGGLYTDPYRLQVLLSILGHTLSDRAQRESNELRFLTKMSSLSVYMVDAIVETISLLAENFSEETELPSHLEETTDAVVVLVARTLSSKYTETEVALQLSRRLRMDPLALMNYTKASPELLDHILASKGIDHLPADYSEASEEDNKFAWDQDQDLQQMPNSPQAANVRTTRSNRRASRLRGATSGSTVATTASLSEQRLLDEPQSLGDQVNDAIYSLEEHLGSVPLDADAVYTADSLEDTPSEVDLSSLMTSLSRPKTSVSSTRGSMQKRADTPQSAMTTSEESDWASESLSETTAEVNSTVGGTMAGTTSTIASFVASLASTAAAEAAVSDYQIVNGILGERYAYAIFSKLLGSSFGPDNWTSELRGQVPGFTHYEGGSLADFRCPDDDGILTGLWYGGEVKRRWQFEWPTFHIEVKSTSGSGEQPFHMKRAQLRTALQLTGQSESLESPPRHVYVLMRVFNIRTRPGYKIFLDPHRCVYKGGLVIESDVEISVSTNVLRTA
ncbi:uncharacterized protein C8Q71DRAFT_906078 [Rhodofomes roseus]|uniref:Protein NO VEIN C-terminal domain-containing protein n=1 Tax=Rhodofomes roseus TaxID=34475 RepID=A0ABQ8KJC2_9APHY|nr:uncharacterized protein C8Q71DRAFT_906078 [Rhodofomes roseus]KAH9838232.1 hypothetical protein C8Q71DRAFT_906078 [Rhodofomes roseus]